jgi:hypothetical protein
VGPPEGTEPEGREPASILLRYSLRATWGFLREQKLRKGTSQYYSQVFSKGYVGLSEGIVPEGREPEFVPGIHYSLEPSWDSKDKDRQGHISDISGEKLK